MTRLATTNSTIPLDLCLHFSNTVNWHGSDHPIDKLTSYSELVEWYRRRGILDVGTAARLLKGSRRDPKRAHLALERARELRESIYLTFSSVSHGRNPKPSDLDILNRNFSASVARLALSFEKRGKEFVWKWKAGKQIELDQILWPIAKSAVDLLFSDIRAYVKECANESEGCGWLFIDTSKNHSRRWCSMSDCGNRSKARSYYAREKSRIR